MRSVQQRSKKERRIQEDFDEEDEDEAGDGIKAGGGIGISYGHAQVMPAEADPRSSSSQTEPAAPVTGFFKYQKPVRTCRHYRPSPPCGHHVDDPVGPFAVAGEGLL